ncbi:MAG: nickel pincer cofactor biosynthesis protein LarC [Acidimicrobiales bacterium]
MTPGEGSGDRSPGGPGTPGGDSGQRGRGSPREPGGIGGGRRVAWFHCFAGIAGDMALGALIDAGADIDEVRRILEPMPLRGWSLRAEPVLRAGLAATKAVVSVAEDPIVRTHAHVVALIEEARLPRRVRERALLTFAALAGAEGRLHRRPPSQVHFHEVGAQDALVDIVGTAAALEVLEIDVVRASPVSLGTGMVRSAHGLLPNPAPAVVELLRGVPTTGRVIPFELTTPTGAALLAALATGFGPQPAMVAEATGFGAGARDLDGIPNVTQVVVGVATEEQEPDGLPGGEPVALVEANLDDVTGEVLARAVAALLEAGAHDAWVTPVVMKKGRPAHVVSALCDPVLSSAVVEVMRRETGTLGVRGALLRRWPAARSDGAVVLEGLTVRVKVSPGRVKVEHDDALAVARRSGWPLREVLARAEEAWRRDSPDDGGPLDPIA